MMRNTFTAKMISEAVVASAAAAAAAVLVSVELPDWVVAQRKKRADEIFYGIILVRIMHSPPDAISVKMTRISAIKFDQKDLVKH